MYHDIEISFYVKGQGHDISEKSLVRQYFLSQTPADLAQTCLLVAMLDLINKVKSQ